MKKLFNIDDELEKDLANYATIERVPQRYVIEKALKNYLKTKGYKRPQNQIQNDIPRGQIAIKW